MSRRPEQGGGTIEFLVPGGKFRPAFTPLVARVTAIRIAERGGGAENAHVQRTAEVVGKAFQRVVAPCGAAGFLLDHGRRLLGRVTPVFMGTLEQRIHQQRGNAFDLKRLAACRGFRRIEFSARGFVQNAQDQQRFTDKGTRIGFQRRHLCAGAVTAQNIVRVGQGGDIDQFDLVTQSEFGHGQARAAGIG